MNALLSTASPGGDVDEPESPGDQCGEPPPSASDDRESRRSAGDRPGKVRVEVTSRSSATSLDVIWLEERVRAALDVMPRGVSELHIVLLDDEEMASLHEKHLGIPGPTDVLTFDLSGSEPGRDPAIEIAIGAEVALRQAGERGHPLEHEVLLYVVHGVLHCLGHDDHDDEAAARMHAEEDRILEQIGVGKVYCPSESPGHAGVRGDRVRDAEVSG